MQLDELKHNFNKEFVRSNSVALNENFKQCVTRLFLNILMINTGCPGNLNSVFDVPTESNAQLREFSKTKMLFRKPNSRQFALTYIGPTFWNKNPETLKHTNICNIFKHNSKKNIYFAKLGILILILNSLFICNFNKHPYLHLQILVF